VTAEPESLHKRTSVNAAPVLPEKLLLSRLTFAFGLLAALIGVLGIVTAHFDITLVSSLNQNYRTMALSAALTWIFLGSVLAYQVVKPFHRITRLVIQTLLFLIAFVEAIEFVLNIQGSHFFIETLLVSLGSTIIGPSSAPISPAAAGLIVLTAIALISLIWVSDAQTKSVHIPDIISIIGIVDCIVSFTFIQSYIFGNPLLYETNFIPIAFLSALAAFFTGAALVTATGPDTIPVKYMIGNTTRALLLRVFVPLIISIILIENVVLVWLSSVFNIHDAVLLSITLVVFTVLIAYVVARISERMGWRLDRAEQELVRKNENLNELNEELTAAQEELRQNLEELTLSEATQRRQADLLGLSYDAIIIWRLDGGIESWNHGAELLYGYTEREARGKVTHQLLATIHPKPWSQIETEMREKGRWEGELRHRTKDGREVIVNTRHQLILEHDGTDLVLESNRDITDRKNAEEALRESEKRYRGLFETMQEGFILAEVVTDDKGRPVDYRFLDVNPTGERYFGHSRSEIIGQTYRSLGIENADENWIEILTKVARTGEPVSVERWAPVGGQWVSLKAYSPSPGQFAAVFENITDRKRSEEALKFSEERFRSVLDNSKDLIYRENLQTGRYEYISPSAETVTGFSADEFLAMDAEIARSIIHPDDIPNMRSAMDGLESTGEAEAEYRWQMKNGNYRWFSNHMSLIRDASGRPLYRNGSIRDITRRKNAEEELKRKNADLNVAYEEISSTQEELRQNLEELSLREQELIKSEIELKEALTEKEALLSEIHHRVKNNLTAFISLLSLDGTYEETEGGKALRTDLQNRARSMALIHETLYRTGKFSKVDMGIYLKNLVDQITKSYGVHEDVKTVVDVHDVTLSVDRATTAGLIINELVTNSFKYAFPPGFDCIAVRQEPCTIRVSLAYEDGKEVLKVADNGRGLPRGFDPFTSKSLGLKLVNFLARHQLRADIEVRSDKGTEFIFHLKNNEETL